MNINRETTAIVWIPRVTVLLLTLLTLFPALFVLMTSFKSTQQFLQNIWALPERIEWFNYSKALIDGGIGRYLLNSTYVVSISIIGIVLFASLAGYALARLRIPKAELLMLFILIPTMFPSESIIMPFYIMMSELRLLNEAYTLIFPFIGWGVPTATFILRNFFQSIPNELLEAYQGRRGKRYAGFCKSDRTHHDSNAIDGGHFEFWVMGRAALDNRFHVSIGISNHTTWHYCFSNADGHRLGTAFRGHMYCHGSASYHIFMFTKVFCKRINERCSKRVIPIGEYKPCLSKPNFLYICLCLLFFP